jgi:hypothetical protein
MADRTPEEVDRMAADIVDLAILAAGGDIELAARVLNRSPYLIPRLALCCVYG